MTSPPPHSAKDQLDRIAARAMRERGLVPDFPADALAQAAAFLDAPAAAPGLPRKDLSDLPWCSIRNDDSKDLDQLSVAERLSDGSVRVLVAIADVDVLVPGDSPVDRHAAPPSTHPRASSRCCRPGSRQT